MSDNGGRDGQMREGASRGQAEGGWDWFGDRRDRTGENRAVSRDGADGRGPAGGDTRDGARRPGRGTDDSSSDTPRPDLTPPRSSSDQGDGGQRDARRDSPSGPRRGMGGEDARPRERGGADDREPTGERRALPPGDRRRGPMPPPRRDGLAGERRALPPARDDRRDDDRPPPQREGLAGERRRTDSTGERRALPAGGDRARGDDDGGTQRREGATGERRALPPARDPLRDDSVPLPRIPGPAGERRSPEATGERRRASGSGPRLEDPMPGPRREGATGERRTPPPARDDDPGPETTKIGRISVPRRGGADRRDRPAARDTTMPVPRVGRGRAPAQTRMPDPVYTRRPQGDGASASDDPSNAQTTRLLLDRNAAGPATYAIGPADADTTGTFLAPIVYSPGLDGLRALAVLAVIAYHAGIPWVRGGLLGVDTFFVLSGFLITGLLIAEYRATRRIDLKDFWVRRVRRLMPALILLLLAVAAYAKFLAAPSDVAKIRGDVLAALFYIANWRFAFSGQSYFDHFSAPSPLLHTWSLAVEEQFYVLWPLVIFLLMRHSARTADKWKAQRRKAQSAALSVAVLGAEASSLVGLGLLLAGVDASKIYYGTEVRVQALLTGAALAVWRAQRRTGFTARGKNLLGWAGLGALLAIMVLWATVNGEARGLYAGGFLGVAVIIAVLVAAIVEVPKSLVARILAIRPLTYIGKISYGLYLWHWPILQAMTAHRTGLHGFTLFAARMGATAACTLLSFYLLENPIRRRKIKLPKPALTAPALLAAVVAVTLVATTGQGANARTAGDLERLASQVEGSNAVAPVPTADARPLRMLVAGDSLATTLVGSQFSQVAADMNVQVADASMLGCGVARLPTRKLNGVAGPTTDGCDQWPARFTARVNEVNPDIAVLLVGRWEVTDQMLDGRWTHVGDPAFDDYLGGQLDLAITTLSARGAKVVLLTTPAVAPREGADGTQYPETESSRVALFNQVLRAAASRHPGVASISDLNAVLTPGNRFTDHVDGVLTRDDGVHITSAGGRLVGRALLPAIVKLVRPTRTDPSPVVTPTSPA